MACKTVELTNPGKILKQSSPSCERNKEPILAALKAVLPASGTVLKIGSGTGEHVAWFAAHLPQLTWQPTDLSSNFPSIRAWAAEAGLYAPEQFRALLHEMLRLYGRETQMLSHSVHLPYVLTLARDSLTHAVHTVMESAAEELARTLTAQVYRRGG